MMPELGGVPDPLDSLNFLDAVAGLPEQLEAAREAAGELDVSALPPAADIDNVVVLGMGGSGIAGDVLAAVGGPEVSVPITVHKQYCMPAFVGPRTLAFAVSYSGNTEETNEMAAAVIARGAGVVVISEGGALATLASQHGALHASCPPGYLPRAALGSLIAPLFVVLDRIGVAPGAQGWLVEAQQQLARRRDRCAQGVMAQANPAREIARRIGGTVPLVYGGDVLGGVGAMRWKADFNENAKVPAFWNAYPELDHNEICGWGQHGDVTRQLVTIIELRHRFEHPQVARRFSITREIMGEAVHQVIEVEAEGEGRLAQLLDLMYSGDWVSCYLALARGVDPGPIDAISVLKERLARD